MGNQKLKNIILLKKHGYRENAGDASMTHRCGCEVIYGNIKMDNRIGLPMHTVLWPVHFHKHYKTTRTI
jgi:hypothetical protein